MPAYRSHTSTKGRNMAGGARALWRATGMKEEDFENKPIIAVVNSFTQFVPGGHVHLKDLGQMVAEEIEKAGGVAKEMNTIAIDDGIAWGGTTVCSTAFRPERS